MMMRLLSLTFVVATLVVPQPVMRAVAQPPEPHAEDEPTPPGTADKLDGTSGHAHSLQPWSAVEVAVEEHTPVRKLVVTATLADKTTMHGRIRMELEPDVVKSRRTEPLVLGRTNLQDLRLSADGMAVDLAMDQIGNLIPLTQSKFHELNGTWTAVGTSVVGSTVFQLELPAASVCEFHLDTNDRTLISSPDSLVVSKPIADGRRSWSLHPGRSSVVTVNCARQPDNQTDISAGVGISSEVRIDSNEASAVWTLTVPPTLPDSMLQFRFSEPCTLLEVALVDGSAPKWSMSADDQILTIELQDAAVNNTFRILAKMPAQDSDELKLPLLIPERWTPQDVDMESRLSLRTSTIRVAVAPTVVVTELRLTGLYENDVAYSADGTQTIELTRFSEDAAARILLAASRPLIDDSIVMAFDRDDQSAEAVAYVSVAARTGRLGKVEWTLPGSWLVTDVRDLNSGQPLLFAIRADKDASDVTTLEAYLRTPVTGSALQTLRINLRSTAGANSEFAAFPSLFNKQYRRQHDFVLSPIDQSQSAPEAAGSLTSEELFKLLPWLPENELKSTQAFRRTSRRSRSGRPATRATAELFSTIDYSVSRDDGSLTESIRVRLRCNTGIPQVVPLRITEGIDVRVSDESATQPPPTLNQRATNPGSWVLKSSPGSEFGTELDIILRTRREVAPQMDAAVVTVVGATQTGGSLQPPDRQDGFSLELSGRSDPIKETVAYPKSPLKELKLRQTELLESGQQVSGTHFLILRQHNGDVTFESVARLYVKSVRTHPSLNLNLASSEGLSVFVNEHPTYAAADNGSINIPLDGESEFNTVDLHFRHRRLGAMSGEPALPVISCPDSRGQHIVTFATLPQGTEPIELSDFTTISTVTSDNFRNIIEQEFGTVSEKDLATEIHPFVSRWKAATAQSRSGLTFQQPENGTPVELRLRDNRFHTTAILTWAIVSATIWYSIHSRWKLPTWLPGVILVLIVTVLMNSVRADNIGLAGTAAGTLAWLVIRLIQLIRVRWARQPVDGRLQPVTAVTLGLLLWTGPLAADEGPADTADSAPRTSTSESDVNLSASDRNSLPRPAATPTTGAMVLSCDVDVDLESPSSTSATIRCLVAVPPARPAKLTLPLDGVTLIRCLVDQTEILPSRDASGQTHLSLPDDAQLPEAGLNDSPIGPHADGPMILNGWKLRRVSYTVRTSPRWTSEAYRISLPHPPSPETRVEVDDPSRLVKTAAIRRIEGSDDKDRSKVWTFPILYNNHQLDIMLTLRNSKNPTEAALQRSTVAFDAEILPTQVRLTSTYTVIPADAQTDSLRIGADSRYQITRVQSADGDPLPYETQADSLVVQISPDTQGVQTVVVEALSESSLDLSHRILVDKIKRVNGRQPDTITFAPNTSEQFVFASITSPKTDLEEITAPLNLRPQLSAGTSSRRFRLPSRAESVNIELVERRAVREVQLMQTAVVGENSIRWTCRCIIGVSGQSVYRQQIRVAGAVRIDNVTAVSGEVSRKQSWTRSGDLIVVALREATIGSLVLQVEGTIERESGSDTRLPVISMPDAQILESSFQLFADTETEAYISDAGSSYPNTSFDIGTDRIPAVPLRLTIRDEAEPIVIRARPERRIVAESAVLVYEISDQTHVARILTFRNAGTTFDVRFRNPDETAGSPPPIALRNGIPLKITTDGDHYVIPRADQANHDSATTLVLIRALRTPDTDGVDVLLPEFEADITVQPGSAFDLRAGPTSDPRTSLPGWLTEAVHGAGIAQSDTTAKHIDHEFDADNQRYRLQSVQAAPVEEQNATRFVASFAEHYLTFHRATHTTGTSEHLVFSNEIESPISVTVPPDTLVTGIRVNGHPRTFHQSDESVFVDPQAEITHLTVQWLSHRAPQGPQNRIGIPVVHGDHSTGVAFIEPPEQLSGYWNIRNAASENFNPNIERSGALKNAVGILNSDLLSTSATGESNPPIGIDGRTWRQITDVSADAAASFSDAVYARRKTRTNASVTANLKEADQIIVDSRNMPSPFHGITLLTGFVLILTSLVSGRRKPSETATAFEEASTVQSQSDSQVHVADTESTRAELPQ